MKYRVIIDESFESEADARKVYNAGEQVYPKAVSLNKKERKHISIHRCFHDEIPPRKCEPIEEKRDAESNGTPILP